MVGEATTEPRKKPEGYAQGDPKNREADDKPGNCATCFPEVYRRGTPEEEQCELENQRDAFDDESEIPTLEPIQFLLPVQTLFLIRTSTVPGISAEVLLPNNCEERSKERKRKT